MSGPEAAGEALRWLQFAQEDLAEAERLLALEDATPRHVCWFAQQATEKALKAALILEGVEVPFWHNLDALRNLLPAGWTVKAEHPDLAELTEWAVEARYPGDWPEATLDEARRAAEQARALLECVIEDFGRRGARVVPGREG
jgi:HEPN domain-containing protein